MLNHLIRDEFSREFLRFFTIKKCLACSQAAITLLLGNSVPYSWVRRLIPWQVRGVRFPVDSCENKVLFSIFHIKETGTCYLRCIIDRNTFLNRILQIYASKFGISEKDVYLCSKLLKLRHSFLNGHGRPRTAFLVYWHWHYGTTCNVLHWWI